MRAPPMVNARIGQEPRSHRIAARRCFALLLCFLALTTVFAIAEEAADTGTGSDGNVEASDASGSADAAASEVQEPQDDLAQLTPRQRYNAGRERLAGGDPGAAADAFLSARDDAGADAELRYRAAFNLGLALAAQADAAAEEPERAIGIYRDSAAWFADAVRSGAEGDDDARVNLELVQRRIQQLADQLNQGRGLEQRLERAIDDQRDLRDRLRRLLADTPESRSGQEPSARGSARGLPLQEERSARGLPLQEERSARGLPSQEERSARGLSSPAEPDFEPLAAQSSVRSRPRTAPTSRPSAVWASGAP